MAGPSNTVELELGKETTSSKLPDLYRSDTAEKFTQNGSSNDRDPGPPSSHLGVTRPLPPRKTLARASGNTGGSRGRQGSKRRRRKRSSRRGDTTHSGGDRSEGSMSSGSRERMGKFRISLRLLLVILICTSILFVTAVTWTVHDFNSRSAVRSLFDNSQTVVRNSTLTFRAEIMSKIALSVSSFVGVAPQLDELTVDALKSTSLQLSTDVDPALNWQRIRSHFTAHVKTFDLAYSFCGTVDGKYYAALRANQPDGRPPKLSYGSTVDTDGVTRLDGWYSWDVNPDTLEIVPETRRLTWADYDPSVRPWFLMGAAANDTVWTDPYLWVGEPPFRLVLGLDAVKPYRNPRTGQVEAVVGADFTLQWIGDFLKTQNLGSDNAAVFIVGRSGEGAGQLIATSKGNAYALETDDLACTRERLLAGVDCGKFVRLAARDSEAQIVREVSKELEREFNSWADIPEQSHYSTEVTGFGLILIETTMLTDEYGLDWVLVIALPEDDILSGIKASNSATLGKISRGNTISGLILGAAVLLSIAIAWFAALKVSEPMLAVEKGMRAMTNLNFNAEEEKMSRLTEIASMQASYGAMRRALTSFHRFLAPSVIERIITGAPNAAELAIDREDCILLLSCVSEWSTISEALPLRHVLEVMESYLSSLFSCVTLAQGTVADFNADQVTCLWRGDNEKHAVEACRAALKQQDNNTQRASWYSRLLRDESLSSTTTVSLPSSLNFYVCIHAGHAALGNVGSPEVMKYSVVGEMPNQTRNLLAKCHEYGRNIVITSEVFRLVSTTYFCHPIDLISVSANGATQMIYELVAPLDQATQEQHDFGAKCAQALEHYVASEYANCLDLLEEVIDSHPTYKPAKIIAKRCRQLALSTRGSGISSEIQMIPASEIKIVSTIGFGGFSEVFLGEWQGTDIAVKKLKFNLSERQVRDPTHLASWRHELVLWSKLRHPNIVFLIGEICDENWLGLATEYLPGGTLQEFYKKLKREGRRISSKLKVQIAKDIAAGMNYLHTREPKIIHRDLKSSNVLLDDQYRAKVTDFGVSKEITGSIAFTATGTPHWMAPEVLRAGIENAEYDERSDVYSFGMLCWEIVSSKSPWEGAEVLPLLSQLLRHPDTRPEIPADCDPRWVKLIKWCWNTDRNARPSFTTVLEYLSKTFEKPTSGVTRRSSVAKKLPVRGPTAAGNGARRPPVAKSTPSMDGKQPLNALPKSQRGAKKPQLKDRDNGDADHRSPADDKAPVEVDELDVIVAEAGLTDAIDT